jgi:hypothetical protein
MSEPLSDRVVRHRLAVLRHAEEVTGNVAMTLPVLRDHPAVLLHVEAPL